MNLVTNQSGVLVNVVIRWLIRLGRKKSEAKRGLIGKYEVFMNVEHTMSANKAQS